MTIKLKCACGNPLTVEAHDVGRKLACSRCGKAFRVSPEKLAALAARSRAAGAPQAAGPVESAEAKPIEDVLPLREPVELDLKPLDFEVAAAASESLELLTDVGTDAQ